MYLQSSHKIVVLAGISFLLLIGLTGIFSSTATAQGFSCTSVSQIPQQECEALVALYSSTNGASWSNNNGWLITSTPCSWYGINCDSGHVVRILLQDNQLNGTLPTQLGNLTNLWNFNVGYNQLTGPIPSTLGNLSADLGHLYLAHNQLSGNIPEELGDMSDLKWLFLHHNQLTGKIPPSLGNLSKLIELTIDANQLSGSVPYQLKNLTKLEKLNIERNSLCEPTSKSFQDWLRRVNQVYSTNIKCKPLVIFVHGCCGGEGSTFADIPKRLTEDISAEYDRGYPVYVIDDPDGWIQYYEPKTKYAPSQSYTSFPSNGVLVSGGKLLPGNKIMKFSADNLKLMIDDAKSRANIAEDEKIILVAHSKGGLVSRMYLESYMYRNDVSKVIMFGTPNLGSPWGNIGDPIQCTTALSLVHLVDVDYELCELTPKAMEDFNKVYLIRAPNVEYYLVAGNISPKDNWVISGGDDFIVGVSSVHGIYGKNVKKRFRYGASHMDNIPPGSEGYFVQENIYGECIKPLISGVPSYCSGYIDIDGVMNTAETTTDYSQAGKWVETVSPSQTITQEFQIDSSGHNSFQLLWSEEELSLSLVDPIGNPITSAVADTNPNIFYFTAPITGVMYATAQYQITSTTPGLWTAVVTGSNTNTQPVTFTVVAYTESPLSLSLSTDKENYSPGETANIVATLTNGTTGLDGATLTAKIWRPDGNIDAITLLPEGSETGKYSATYNQTSTSGYFYIEVEATGILSGTPFVRSTQKQFVVNSNNASLTGPHSDTPKDDDGNSYYESLEISVGVNVAVAGDYSIVVLLKDKDGEVIANQVVNTSLITGVNQVIVPFDGQIIRDHGVDGPYTAAEVRTVDNTGIFVLADEAFNVHTTVAYKYTQFGDPSQNIYLPIILKNQ